MSICTKADPIPIKDVPEDYLQTIGIKGVYLGVTDIIQALYQDTIEVEVGSKDIDEERVKTFTMSRWMQLLVNQAWRPKEHDRERQQYLTHNGSTW